MMTDRSLNLVIWRVRVASDYWLILTKLSILDALCGAELRMSADDQGTTASRAARNILRCGFIRGLLRHGYSAENSQVVFWLSPYLCIHPDLLADDLKRRLMFRLCGLPLVRQAGGSCFRDLSLPVVRKGEPDADSSSCRRLQAGGDLAKCQAKIGADGPHHYDRGNGNQCRDQAVLDRRNTFLIFDQTPQAQ